MATTITVSEEIRDQLWSMKRGPSESYEDVLVRELGLDHPDHLEEVTA